MMHKEIYWAIRMLLPMLKVWNYGRKKLQNKKILIMGVAYKEDINDTRHSPSEVLFRNLRKKLFIGI